MKKLLSFAKTNYLVSIFIVLFIFLNLKIAGDTFFIDKSSNIHTTMEGYGDIPLHLTQITKFGHVSSWNLMDPIYFGTNLQYPFIFNFLRGLILLLTNSLYLAVLWPLYVLVIANIILVFIIYNRVLKNHFWSICASTIFFLGSGLNWYYYFFKKINFQTFQLDLKLPYQNIDFGPAMISMVHQHTFHFGLSLFLIAVYLLIVYQETGRRKYAFFAIIPIAILPLSHTHSFVAIGLFVTALLVWEIVYGQHQRAKYIFVVGFISVIISIPQFLYLMSGKFSSGFSSFRLGWMTEIGIGSVNFVGTRTVASLEYLKFLWINFGVIVPLFIIVVVYCLSQYYKDRKSEEGKRKIDGVVSIYIIGLSACLVFILANIIRFQPWDFDNNKILIYFIFFIAPLFIWFISQIFRSNKVMRNVAIVLIVLIICFSGLVDLYYRVMAKRSYLPIVFDSQAISFSNFIQKNTDPNKLILVGAGHRNVPMSLAGRQSLMGYPGWLWTRGIEYGPREREINNFYQNPVRESDIFQKYPIGYILVDDFVKANYKNSLAVLEKEFIKVYDSPNYILYSLAK
jgi:hypothetical protein